jgi:hypothetical protein
MRRVLVSSLSVHARRAVLARAAVCLAQPVKVDVMGQRRERLITKLSRQRRYPFESR